MMSLIISEQMLNYLTVRANINEEDMFKWAVQFADHAVVLEPVSLKERIIKELNDALKNYNMS